TTGDRSWSPPAAPRAASSRPARWRSCRVGGWSTRPLRRARSGSGGRA
ncbi:MAG: Uncharacterized protein RSP_6119, partial [uncultured Pseudonocardia sp.]